MSDEPKNVFRIHLGLVLAEVLCIPAFIFETYRALSGNELSWAYVVEWPLLGGYAVFMWRKMLREERGIVDKKSTPDRGDDPQLAAWNAYLASVHQKDERVTPESADD